jgi:hypothetical protein
LLLVASALGIAFFRKRRITLETPEKMETSAYRLALLPIVAFAIGAATPMYADTIVEGQVGQNLGGSGSNLYSSGAQNGSAVSDIINWNFTCSTCVGYGISANGAAKVIDGSLGASSSVTVTGSPGAPLYGTAASDAVFTDMLTITGGTIGTSGVLELTYALDGVISNTGTGLNSSSASLYMTAATTFQYDNEGIESGGYVEIYDNGTKSDTVTFYIPFTYGTAFGTELDLDAGALFVPVDSTPYTATVNYYNTAALSSALVFGGTPSNPGAENYAANIGSTSGLGYGPNGISATPELGTLFLVASALGIGFFLKQRVGRATCTC